MVTGEQSTATASAPSVERILDTRGVVCPEPIVRLATAIREIPVGAHLRLIATDPGADADVRAWARATGHELIDARPADGELHFVLRRTR